MNTIDHRAVIKALQPVYKAKHDQLLDDDEKNDTNNAVHMVSFYDFLLRVGYTRRQLTALGITRRNALGDF